MPLSEQFERDAARCRDAANTNPFDLPSTPEFTRSVGQLAAAVDDATMHPSVYRRVISAIASGLLSSFEVRELIEAIDRNKVLHRGRYFIVSIKRLFERHGIPW